jgi:multidrug efflux pump
MNFSAIFIRRPVATTLLTIALVLSGAIAFRLLPISPLPHIDFPTISVAVSLPGADPETMATSVAMPLERQLGHIAGVTEMTSTSTRGTTGITLQFDLDRNIDGAARDVQAAINAARGYLPPNLPIYPIYRKVNPSEAPILIMALTSDIVGPAQIYDAASTILSQKLSQVEGVGQVFVGGGSLPAVRVELNPQALSKYGISLNTVSGVLASTNANRPKGQLSDKKSAWEIQTNDQLRAAEQYKSVIITYKSGAALRLADVGTVQDSVEDLRAAGIVNGKRAVVLIIFRQPGANIIETVDNVRSLLPRLTAEMPGGIMLTVLMDRTTSIRGSLRDVERTLIIAVMLVIFVVFVFLRNIRSTLIPGVAVVASLIGTFGAMYLLGYNLDNLSLMAITIATGFVVDDAIVVLENITRYMEKGMTPVKAALAGSKEITFTVISMSVSLIAVFTPLLLMGGVVGRLFREFSVTLSVAIAISLALSLTTTPMMCATLVKRGGATSHGSLYRASEKIFDRVLHRYGLALHWTLGHPRFMILLVLVAIGLNVVLFIFIPKGFFPEQDTGSIMGTIQADQDISFQAMRKKMGAVVDIVKSDPDVSTVMGYTGGGTGTNAGRMFISLKPFGQRRATAGQVIARLRRKLLSVPGAPSYLQPVQDLRVGGRMSGGLYQYTLQGENLSELNLWGLRLFQKMRTLRQLADANSDLQEKGLEVDVVIDRKTASRFGITPQMIDETLYNAFGQAQVSITYTLMNQYHVVMEVDPVYWQNPETLRDIYVTSPSGGVVPLSAFAHFERTTALLAVNHQGQFPAMTISFNLPQGGSLGDAVKATEDAQRQMGMPGSIRGGFQGTAQAFQSSLANEPILILAALFAVYIVLGVLYESYIHPITILSTLPSAGVGAMLGLMLFRMDMSIIALIGIILLIGLVKKNGIMMVDFALEFERREGKSPEEAIYQASLLRFRPIMMTTMAAMFGAIPLAVSMGIGSEIRRPLGVSIIGGLMISQTLTLFTTPVIYLYLDRFRLWVNTKRKLRKVPARPSLVLLAFLAVLFATSCSVGPDYVRPTAEVPAHYKEMNGWKIAQPGDESLRGKWWKIFNDPALDAYEEQVSISNQNIAQAEAQYRQALALVQSARAGYFPVISAGASYTRSLSSSKVQTEQPGVTLSDYLLPVSLSWELDVWGKIRRQVEAGVANAQASAADLQSVRLSAQAQLAQSYFQLRVLDEQKRLFAETIVAYQKTLDLTRNRYASGIASKADVLQAETQLKTTQAQAIDIDVQRAQLEHAIALLCGKPASAFSIPVTALNAVPPSIPVGLPSQLLERRPDVASAERLMASANAQIGVAMAAYYPSVTLSATGGFESSSFSDWLSWPSRFWSLGPAISETIFDGGLRSALTAQSRAAYDANVASYRQAVLTAFQGVEDNLAAMRILEDEARAQHEAVRAAQQSEAVAVNQYKEGIVSYLNVITAQTVTLTNKQTELGILSRRMVASAQLIKALGGGWGESPAREGDKPSRQ